MDRSTSDFVRVKLKYHTKGKLAKLDRRVDASLSSMANLTKLIFKHFPEIEELVEGPSRTGGADAEKQHLEMKCKDSAGDYITLESEDDLDAMELSERSDLEFQIDVILANISTAHSRPAPAVVRPQRNYEAPPFSSQMDEAFPSNHGTKLKESSLQPCRNLQKDGHCRYGQTCRFSHALAERSASSLGRQIFRTPQKNPFTAEGQHSTSWTRSYPLKKEVDCNLWVNNQVTRDAMENIEHLSGETGLRMLSKVVEQRKLPDETITRFVKLLVREEIRSSLLRQKTNKIYGVLVGSPFLLQLQFHINRQFGIENPRPQDLMPYLLLIEELQSRTTDGWKEVPLVAMQSAVSRLKENPGKADLVATVNRLIDHREKLERSSAVALPDKCLQGVAFRQMPIVADKEELFVAKQGLPVNRVRLQYSTVNEYLETHFQLLREDCIDPLRQGIKAYRSICSNTSKKASESSMQELRVYSRVQLVAVRCGDNGVEYGLSFHLPKGENTVQYWEVSKKLMYGALLCISSDQFQTHFWGVVARRDVKDLAKGLVAIRIIGESDANVTAGLQSGKPSAAAYVMVESTAAYFEAYYHVLKTLQREEMEHVPFTPYLLHLDPRVSPPSYLLRRRAGDEYDFSSAFPDIHERLGRSSIRVLQSEWPSGWADSLDGAQQDALRQGLTKELAIIQGPPGTGKTFLGLLLVKILLANLTRSPGHDSNRTGGWRAGQSVRVNGEEEYDMSGPILVICYTNHALDQFLEGIYRKGETNLIRIGGRGKSETLKECNLQSLIMKQRTERRVEGSHLRFFGQGRSQKDHLESEINKCIDSMGFKFVTPNMLEGVATSEQIGSLFSLFSHSISGSSSTMVKFWLNEVDPYYLAHQFYIDVNESQWSEEDDSDDESKESAKTPSRGRMKMLPKSGANQVGRRQGARRVARVPRDVPDQQFDFVHDESDDEGEDGSRAAVEDTDEGDEGIHPRLDQAEDAENGPHPDAHHVFAAGGPIDEGNTIQAFVDTANVWHLNLIQRRKLHEYWSEEIRMNCGRHLKALTQEYEEACKNANEVEKEIQLSLLRKSKVVGMTTTAAAKHHDVLKALKPEIVIVEEAAEVLEAHILACLNPSVKHLILIGDHLQLRPSVAVDKLSTKQKLDVSMFERLVTSGVEHVTLQEQRRMRPTISKLMRSLYPRSRDHESVTQYEAVSGVMSNVFFFDHKAAEDNTRDAGSKVNSTEAKLVVGLCLYLLNQGCYKPDNIVILSMYSGQLQEIKKGLKERSETRLSARPIGESNQDPGAEETNRLPRVSSVDNYQGEESDIIILSLVRSNDIETNEGVGKIGFLKIPNRICVALTRARKGLFIFGNADLLAEKNTLWKRVTNDLREDGALGPQLDLYCQNHPDTVTKIAKVEDFKQVEDGGCSLPCEYQLECGHVCPRRCHPGSHDLVVCPKPCLRKSDECGHKCHLRCHGAEDCPPCKVTVTRQLLCCKHEQRMVCSNDVKDEVCRSACTLSLACGHQCRKLCGRPCTELCQEKVKKLLPCGHLALVACHRDPDSYCCDKPCEAMLPDCQHHCKGSCGKCKRGTAHILCQQKCGRILPCGHPCESGCSLSCPPCEKRCRKRCFHSRCSEPCGQLCKPCREACPCQCEHHRCDKLCHEICTRPRCDLPCPKIRKCGHPCIGLCGDSCPTKCRVCHPETLDIITRMTLEEYENSDRFIQLEDCSHIFEVSGLDTWMDANETTQQDGSVAIKVKECPECKTPIWRTHRYSNIVKKKHSQVQDVKKKVLGHELTRQGNLLLEQGKHESALSVFTQALQRNPGLMEAHFGIGCAFFAAHESAKAITHFSFIVERSSFAPPLANLIESARRHGHAVGFAEKFGGRSSSSRAGDPLTIQAIVQWASALSQRREFIDAIKMCDAVLGRDPENRLASNVKEKAKKGEVELVVQAMAADVGQRPGHWYTCQNGHYYTIGECGGATETSRCPDCKALVGGGSHKLLPGNRHSNIDGSERSSWPSD